MSFPALSVLGWIGSLAAPGMLWALAAMAIPVAIHLLSRRRATVMDWGAMQFLEMGQRAQRKFQFSEMLLLAGRMGLLGLVALAAARPLLAPSDSAGTTSFAAAAGSGTSSGDPCDVVLVLDGSESMGRKQGETTPRQRAIDWSRSLVKQLPGGSAVAVLDAREMVRPLIDLLNYDRELVDEALAKAPEPRGSSDLAAALVEAFRILDGGRNPRRDVILLSDGQRAAWKPGETTRWSLLHELYNSAKTSGRPMPQIWAALLKESGGQKGGDASVNPLTLDRGLVPAGLPLTIRTSVQNSGVESTDRVAELLVDGVPIPGSAQRVGPIPPGSQVPVRFETVLKIPGSHRMTVRLRSADDDPLSGNDESEATVEAAEGLPVLLVDGMPRQGSFQGATDFLRAALTPSGDAAPSVRARTISSQKLAPETVGDSRVIVLASVPRLDGSGRLAVENVLASGGGVLIAPGESLDSQFYADAELLKKSGWLPAAAGPARGQMAMRRGNTTVIAHPDARSFSGTVMPVFGEGDDPALARSALFWYRQLEPTEDGVVVARLDNGDPWLVEKKVGSARVAMLAGTLDARGGTLPANPDFVPWLHTLIFHLAEPAAATRVFQPGEAIRLELTEPAPEQGSTLMVHTPDGREVTAEWVPKGPGSEFRFRETAEPGIYTVDFPASLGRSGPLYLHVGSDPRESDPAGLETQESTRLAEGWPMHFESDPNALGTQILAVPGGGSRPIWRWLVLLALGGLCLEVLATRRLALNRGIATEGVSP